MPPKKKEEEPPPAEELLPAGYSIGCEVHWVTFTTSLESGMEVKPGMKGTLEACGGLRDEVIDDVKRWFIETVTVKFEDFEEPQIVQFASLSIEPPPLELLDELSTGLKLPLRGVDMDKIWALGENAFDKQSEMLTRMLGLNERYGGTGRREIVCDFHLYNLIHAKCLCLNSTQGAVFHAIMEQMLTMMTSTTATPDTRPADMCTSEACFREFQRLMLLHARQDPPGSLGIFRDSEVRLLTDFASVTLFKHYLLYQYCINFDREIETLRFNPHLERPSPPPDLKLGNPDLKRRQVPENTHHLERDLSMEAPVNLEEQDEPTEEEKVAQLVQEKLKEVEEKLKERLVQRESEFMQRMEEEKASGKKKPK